MNAKADVILDSKKLAEYCEKAKGIIYGLAIGDVLGRPAEFMKLSSLKFKYGQKGIETLPEPALFTDDTQMSIAVAEALNNAGHCSVTMINVILTREFIKWYDSPENNRSPGATCLKAVERMKQGMPAAKCGDKNSKGCGSAMRAAPIGFFYQHDSARLRDIAHAAGICTHSHPTADAACIGAAYAVKHALDNSPPDRMLAELLAFTAGISTEFEQAILKVEEVLDWDDEEKALKHLSEGWLGEEALALALYCFLRSPDNYVATVLRGANTNGDSDSVACIAGSISGAYLGVRAIPAEWICKIEKSDYLGDLAERMARTVYSLEKQRLEVRKEDVFSGSNQDILSNLFEQGKINLRRGSIFDHTPEPMPDNFDFDRIEGMMLGLAIGDSLGRTTEGRLPSIRRARYGKIKDYIPTRRANGQPIGVPSDDTQLAFWTLEQILKDRGFIPDNVAKRFTRNRIFGIGSAVRRFLSNYKSGRPWYESGPKSAGNGALMRIAPMIMAHFESPSSNLWVDTALSAMITHNDSGSIAGCVSFVNILWQLLRMDSAPRQEWWLETYVDVAKDLELNKKYRPRGGDFMDYEGPIWRFAEEKVGDAYRHNVPMRKAFKSWYSGAYLLETIPCVLFILMKYGDDLEEAIVRAVNDTKDNDTIAAIVGAAVGALHGKKAIPERWISKLSGRTREKDEGKIFELLDTARKFGVTGSPKTRINYIPWNHNEKHHDGAFGGAGKKYQLISLKTGKESNCELREQNNEISIIFQNGDVISELLTGFDFFDSFNCLQEKLKKMGIQLKACGQCLYFGFSSMAYQCSEGEAGYCTFPKGLDIGSEGTVDVLGVCDCFELRKKETSTSPFLPA